MAAATRGLLAFWMGGAAAPPVTTQGGVKSLLAPWMGGAGAPPTAATTGGTRGLMAFWMGGAGAPPTAATTGGTRGLMAFWMGGAAASANVDPPVPPPPPFVDQGSAGRGSGWGSSGWSPPSRRSIAPAGYARPDAEHRAMLRDEDDLMLTIIIQAVTKGLL